MKGTDQLSGCCIPLASSGKWVPTCSKYRLLRSFSCPRELPLLFSFLHQHPREPTVLLLALWADIFVIAATSPASLWDKRRATAQWKLAFATCVNNPSEYPGFDLPSECSEATINSKVPHQVKMSLGVSSPRKLWSSPCLNWKRLSICVRHYTVSYLVFFTVLLNGKYKWLIPLLVISATQMVSSCSRLPPECVLLGCLVQYMYMRLCLHPYSMSFCIGSVIEKNPQFCDFFN